MEIKHLIQKYPFYKSIDDKFAMWQISGISLKKERVCYSEIHSLFFLLSGSVRIMIDKLPITIDNACFIDIIGRNTVSILSASEEAICYNLVFSESVIDELFINKPPFPLSYIMDNQSKPIPLLDKNSVSILSRRLSLIDEIINDGDHLFLKERLFNGLMLLYLDMANIYIFQEQDKRVNSDSDRKRELFVRFAKMSNKCIKENHTVSFYSKQLCITPQYLDRIVKYFAHMTVYQFLQKNMIGVCVKLLKDTDKTILQISEELNFSDQSTFTKYFKRYTGFSPSEYRQNMK